ncbi:MAG: RNA 2',3'-cyclic phosphodiesterase [Sporomusa sp.]
MRLFIAANFSDETRAQLHALQDKLRSYATNGSFSLPENLHLTLAFLGECDARQVAAAKQVINAVRFEPFAITIAGGGYFDKGRPNLVFCGLQNDSGYSKLRQLQSDLSMSLSAKGFELEQRKFWPHITLGRKVVWQDTSNFSSFIDSCFPMIEECVTSIELMKSERIGGKLTYTAICEKKL